MNREKHPTKKAALMSWCVLLLASSRLFADAPAPSLEEAVTPLVEASCLGCHGENTKTGLDLETLGYDLSQPNEFRHWVRVYDRVAAGEMPPQGKRRPDSKLVEKALVALRDSLHATDSAAQKAEGRVPARRLTAREYEYTLHDLLHIGGDLTKHLPPENGQARFDTISTEQGISPIHIRSYLSAADAAIDEAIQLGIRPYRDPVLIDYQRSHYTNMWINRPLRNGGETIMRVDDAIVTFDDKPHMLRTDYMGHHRDYAGLYRIRVEAYAYQAKTPVTLLIIRSSEEQGGAELVGAFDIYPAQPRSVSVTTYLTRDDYLYLAPAEHDTDKRGRDIFRNGGWKNYRGEGLAIKSFTVQGPLTKSWPPESTREMLSGIELIEHRKRRPGQRFGKRPLPRGFTPRLSKKPRDHIHEILARLAPKLFRRPVQAGEVESFLRLAERALEGGRSFEEALRVSLRAMLSSPQFLYHSAKPGPLDSFALATRLSYFLWKTAPDDELTRLARENKLTDPGVLATQVDRLIDDERSMRFVSDFLGQWVGLYEIDATTPDDKLYVEYDDVLRRAMLNETEWFFRSLIARDDSARLLIDSDFTYLNRRLARHYGIDGVREERMRRIKLPKDSVRGGLLTQASVLKITANGTVTSPVKRGAFVLSTLLGRPPSPPPPDIGSIEPDTRGTTTIRETLAAHRNTPACAACHREIDPPGFALESFDPIGGFRTRYRSTGRGEDTKRKFRGRSIWEYREGPAVDASGTAADGTMFRGIREFKNTLRTKEADVARNLLSNLVAYATGGEIRFADRTELDALIEKARAKDFGVRTLIHLVVQSRMFRNK